MYNFPLEKALERKGGRLMKKMYLMAVDERDWPPVDCAEYYLFQLERVACSNGDTIAVLRVEKR